MLVENQEGIANVEGSTTQAAHEVSNDLSIDNAKLASRQNQLAKFLRIEWLGQTVASLCWIVSVFCYGISSTGDWLQLGAASAWMVANIAAVASTQAD